MAPEPEPLEVAVRGKTTNPADEYKGPPYPPWFEPVGPSDWVLVFDTETTVDHIQQLRFGGWQLYWKGTLRRQGLFYDTDAVTFKELDILSRTAADNGWELSEIKDWLT